MVRKLIALAALLLGALVMVTVYVTPWPSVLVIRTSSTWGGVCVGCNCAQGAQEGGAPQWRTHPVRPHSPQLTSFSTSSRSIYAFRRKLKAALAPP